HRKRDIVEVVAPEHDLAIAHVEAPADPQLDGVHVGVEPGPVSAKCGAKESANALTTAQRWQAHVGVLDMQVQEVHCSVDIPSASEVQDPLDDEGGGRADP